MRISFAMFMLIAIMPMAVAKAEDCANASSQTAMNICADQAYKKTDAQLNSVYKQIVGRLKDNKDTLKLLVTAQRNWITFRDSQCAFETSASAQGSVYPMLVLQCRDGLTSKRIDELKPFLACQEQDMSCPVP
jgi:uncharacterized protein YecT (DUF1311 family)